MKYMRILCLVITSTVSLCACNLIDSEPKQAVDNSSVYKTSKNVKLALIGGYDALSAEGALGGYNMFLSDLLGNKNYIDFNGTYEEIRGIYNKNQIPSNKYISFVWTDFYNVINISNNVVGSIDLINKNSKDQVEGEAKFLRGLSYFELVRDFSKPWNDGDPTQNLGVPLVLKPESKISENKKSPRAPVAKVYKQVIGDLKDAKKLLPDKNGIYATKFAASATLSRVYLQQQNYLKAAKQVNYVIENGEYSLTGKYGDEFNKSEEPSSGDIFSIIVTQQDGVNIFNTYYANNANGGRGDVTISLQFLNNFNSDSERLSINYSDDNGVRSGKFINQYGNVPVIRLAEMYLTRAECNFRLGVGNYVGPNTPAKDLNIVRNRVGLSNITSPDLQDILNERRLELAFEGFWLHDEKRLEESVLNLSWDSPTLVFPIPQREMLTNENLVQNEGY